jgi:hypothetical protein
VKSAGLPWATKKVATMNARKQTRSILCSQPDLVIQQHANTEKNTTPPLHFLTL